MDAQKRKQNEGRNEDNDDEKEEGDDGGGIGKEQGGSHQRNWDGSEKILQRE